MSFTLRSCLLLLAAGLATSSACAPTQTLEGADLTALKALTDEVEPERVWNDLTTLTQKHAADQSIDCSPLFPASDLQRFPELCHLSNSLSGAFVEDRLRSLGFEVTEDVSPGENGLVTRNFVADLKGVSKPDEVILVGAHYDAFWQGADDNSSGTVALLELARVLSQHHFERTLRFTSFDLEEFGIIGSHRYVKEGKAGQVVTALVFDCVGYYSDAEGSQESLPGLPSPSRGDFLAAIGNDDSVDETSQLYQLNNALGLMNVVPLISSGNGTPTLGFSLTLSDHLPFWFNHQKAVFLSDTAPYRNPNYHQATDTLDTLEPARLGQAVRVAAAALAFWAGGPTP